MVEDCVFCKIVEGEIEGDVVFETENFFFLRNIKPLVEGHSMVIPKKHYGTFLDLPKEFYEEFMGSAKRGAELLLKETGAESFNLVANNGKVSGQVVPHLHLHILPRKEGDEFRLRI